MPPETLYIQSEILQDEDYSFFFKIVYGIGACHALLRKFLKIIIFGTEGFKLSVCLIIILVEDKVTLTLNKKRHSPIGFIKNDPSLSQPTSTHPPFQQNSNKVTK